MPVGRFPEVTIEHIVQAVDEACSNVIEHSYGMVRNNELSMTMNSDKKKVTFLIEDTGIGIQSAKVEKPDIREYVEQRKQGGWGRYIITQVMDEVNYTKRGKKNKLTMVKYYNDKGEQEAG
jgi:anti-sigma regulatory factor (Ser/Thr protein kinase)